ncbi:unnamed protein product, partial [Ectocarpus sp. 8 AP-2014]
QATGRKRWFRSSSRGRSNRASIGRSCASSRGTPMALSRTSGRRCPRSVSGPRTIMPETGRRGGTRCSLSLAQETIETEGTLDGTGTTGLRSCHLASATRWTWRTRRSDCTSTRTGRARGQRR